jgi:hypothetical protein
MVVHAEAGSRVNSPVGATDPATVSEGRSGWDAVGSKIQDPVAATVSASAEASSAVDRHQARKRAMVRRMLLLMVAYR